MDKEIVMTETELNKLVENASQKAVDNALRQVTPPAFASTTTNGASIKFVADHSEKQKQAEHLREFINAASMRNHEQMKSLQSNNMQWYGKALDRVQKANFNEGTGGQGGYIVPSFWYDQVFSNVEQYGFARKLGKIFPMQSNKHYLNTAGAASVAWTSEGSAPTATDSTSFFTQTTLTAQRLTGAYVISRQLIDDANVAIMDYMASELGRAVAQAEDEAFFNGSGSGATPTGIIGTSGVTVQYLGGASTSGKTTRAGWSWKDLMRARTATKTTFMANAVFVLPQTAFGYLLAEAASTGQPAAALTSMFQPIEAPDAGISALNANQYITPTGKKLVVVPDSCFPTDAVTTATGLYFDFSKYAIIGTRQEAEVNVFNQAYGSTVIAGSNQVAIEISERVGFAFPIPSAAVVIKTSTT